MKILHISHSDIMGGAGRAAYRTHKMLLKNAVDSSMFVNIKSSSDPNVFSTESKIGKVVNGVKQHLRFPINKILNSKLYGMHSPSILSSKLLKKINSYNADIVHLHWVQGEMLSIKDISKINKPLIWSFHDMWPFCGCEHYAYNDRYTEGYKSKNRSENEPWYFDINRWRWSQKAKLFTKPIQILSPSKWMTDCVKKSYLMKKWPVETISHPIDTSQWSPKEKYSIRKELNLEQNSKIITFGAAGGIKDERKGYKFFELTLKYFESITSFSNLTIITFGGGAKKVFNENKLKFYNFGNINNDEFLRKIYSCSDVFVIPSKKEAFGLTALEANACGTPVVCFDRTGTSDIIEHKKTGYIAKFLNEKDFATGIEWVLKNSSKTNFVVNSRKRVENLFSEEVILKKFLNVYNNLLLIK